MEWKYAQATRTLTLVGVTPEKGSRWSSFGSVQSSPVPFVSRGFNRKFVEGRDGMGWGGRSDISRTFICLSAVCYGMFGIHFTSLPFASLHFTYIV